MYGSAHPAKGVEVAMGMGKAVQIRVGLQEEAAMGFVGR